jgi:hypothetical protein
MLALLPDFARPGRAQAAQDVNTKTIALAVDLFVLRPPGACRSMSSVQTNVFDFQQTFNMKRSTMAQYFPKQSGARIIKTQVLNLTGNQASTQARTFQIKQISCA